MCNDGGDTRCQRPDQRGGGGKRLKAACVSETGTYSPAWEPSSDRLSLPPLPISPGDFFPLILSSHFIFLSLPLPVCFYTKCSYSICMFPPEIQFSVFTATRGSRGPQSLALNSCVCVPPFLCMFILSLVMASSSLSPRKVKTAKCCFRLRCARLAGPGL